MLLHRLAPSALVAAVLLAAITAHAAPAAASPPVVEPAPPRWYGWQTLSVDAAAVGLYFFGISQSNDAGAAFAAMGGIAYLAGAPIVHAQHGNRKGAIRSVLVRVGVPAVGGAIGLAIASGAASGDGRDDEGPLLGAVGGAAIGVVAAALLDATLLAREPRPDARSWSPVVQVDGRQTVVGFAGTF